MWARVVRLPQKALMAGVRFYRYWFKPWLGNACRFEPTCSAYALDALQLHGAVLGTGLTTMRLLRCHPWCVGGLDPVPERWAGQGLFTRLYRPPSPEITETTAPTALVVSQPERSHP